MVKRWIFYLVVLVGCIVFFAAYQGWVAWLLLLTVVLLPLLSLLLSLVPMLRVTAKVSCPTTVTVGDTEMLNVTVRSRLPIPACSCRFQASHSLTGESRRMVSGDALPTDHCGALTLRSAGFYVYDFLGLFRLRRRRIRDQQVLIRPEKISMNPPETLSRFLAHSWQPKYGGGFSEQHELRLYRPGDGLNQVHWKLSAKTGKLIIREPMVPRHGLVLLTMDLRGTPDVLDRKLARLQWMAEHLLTLGLQYELHVLTGSGLLKLPVRGEGDLPAAMDAVLRASPATEGSILNNPVAASWQYHIGGDADDA